MFGLHETTCSLIQLLINGSTTLINYGHQLTVIHSFPFRIFIMGDTVFLCDVGSQNQFTPAALLPCQNDGNYLGALVLNKLEVSTFVTT